MANVERTRSALLDLAADSVVGSISAQDLRDMLVSILPAEHINAYDFWAQPNVTNTTTQYSTRGWHLHSQTVSSKIANGLSFGKVYALTASNTWSTAGPDTAGMRDFIGIAADSYTANYFTAKILIRGMVNNPSMSDYTASCIGLKIYLLSNGAISVTASTVSKVIGIVMPSTVVDSYAYGSQKFWFDGSGWGVINI